MSRNPHFHNLTINNKYKDLKPSISQEAYQQLEQAILSREFQEPIIAWKRTILDGHKRFEICKKNGIKLRTRSINFQYEEEAICWICKKEMEREHLPESYVKYYIGKYYHAKRDLLAKMYPVQNYNAHYESTRPPIEQVTHERNYTTTLVSREFNIGSGTVYNYSVYSRDIDNIRIHSAALAEMILSDRVHVSLTAVSMLAKLPLEDLKKVYEYMLLPDTFRLHQTDIEDILKIKRSPSKNIVKEKEPEIKHIPKYDPDAEISSLTLTIPSWISSITRTMNAPSFSEASVEAKTKLDSQLWDLQRSIIIIQSKMKEETNE